MSKVIELSQGKVAVVSNRDFTRLNQFSWHVWRPLNAPHLAYAARKIRKKDGRYSKAFMHREVLCAPPGMEVDHRNRDGLDNRRRNLRLATASQNQANSRQHRDAQSSRFKGVTWHKGSQKWQSSIQFQKHRFYLGWFVSEIDAALAYNRKAIALFGSYARLNSI